MRMRENMQDIFKVFTGDETLLRLLFYKPQNASDDPLSTAKPNVLDKPILEKWKIIQDRIKTVPKVDDLDTEPKCRLLFYPGNRHKTGNYLVSDQDIVIDILVHFDYEDVDQRLEWICDVINELMFDKRITGMGKVTYGGGYPGLYLKDTPQGYVGYRLVYSFGSGNK
jgi:hypothetical protein